MMAQATITFEAKFTYHPLLSGQSLPYEIIDSLMKEIVAILVAII